MNFEAYLFDQLIWLLDKGFEFEKLTKEDIKNLETVFHFAMPLLVRKQTDLLKKETAKKFKKIVDKWGPYNVSLPDTYKRHFADIEKQKPAVEGVGKLQQK